MPHVSDRERATVHLCGVLILCVGALGQAEPRTGVLKVLSIVTTSEVASSLVLPAKCDATGNAWVRVASDKVGGGPILKITPDGKNLVRYTLDAIPPEVASDARMRSFAPGLGDELVVLLEKQTDEIQSYLVRYDSDGGFRSSSRIEAHLRPSFVGIFPSGDLLIGGEELPPDPKTLPAGQPSSPNRPAFLGLFNNRGQLLRRISIGGDLKPKKRPAETPAGERYFKIDTEYKSAMVLSIAETGEDGNIYLTLNTPAGPVHVVSPSGTVSSSLRLVPPKGANLSTVKIASGRLIVLYTRNKPDADEIDQVLLNELDLSSGEKVAEYSHSNFHIGSVLACAAPPFYTFLGADEAGHLTIVKTAPE
jgi:hypothetical protein